MNQTQIRLCIPSYNRPELITEKTLAFLKASGYPSEKIIIFVSDESEQIRYQTANPSYQVVVGKPGLKAQRQFISDWLEDDEIYISMDDDVQKVECQYKSFLDIVRDGIERITTRTTGLYGVLPNNDKRNFKDTDTEHLSFILGAFFICRNHHDIQLQGLCETDDYERAMLYFIRYGSVIRYKGAGVQTKYQGTSGGRTGMEERKASAVAYLASKYPDLCKAIIKKGIADLRLNWRAKVFLPDPVNERNPVIERTPVY